MIDNTDIPRCVSAVGREFKFPLDIELLPSPELNDISNSALIQCFRDVSCNSTFVQSILEVLIEE